MRALVGWLWLALVTSFPASNRNLWVMDMRSHTGISSNSGRWAAIPLRLIVGYGFIAHGYAKLIHGPAHFAAILHALGVPSPALASWLTILTELVGGAAVLLGAFIPLVSIPMSVVLLSAMFTVHLPYGFSSIKLQAVTAAGAQFGPPGYEVDLLYLACLASLVLAGPGPLAVGGSLLRKKSESKADLPQLLSSCKTISQPTIAN